MRQKLDWNPFCNLYGGNEPFNMDDTEGANMKKIFLITSLILGLGAKGIAAEEYEDSNLGSDSALDESTATGATTETTEVSRTQVEEDDDDKLDKGGPFIEPFLFGSQSEGAVEARGIGAVDESSDIREAGIGLRLGGHISEVVFLAADARYGRAGFDESFYDDAETDHYNYGITLGAQTPWAGVRVWGTSILGGEFNPNAGANDLDVKFGGANGYRVGAGLHIAAVSLNLEYQDMDYRTTDIESPGTTTVTGVDASQQGYSLSIGFPVEL
jgi:hypothetical protein